VQRAARGSESAARWRWRSRLREQLRELLGEQLLELEPLPGRMRAILERRRVEPGGGSCR
jgi:hypothetical protein